MTLFHETQLRSPFQALALDEDRILILAPGRRFILRGIGFKTLSRIVELLDGSRAMASIVEELAQDYPRAGVEKTLSMLLKVPTLPAAPEPRHQVKALLSPGRPRICLIADATTQAQLAGLLPDAWDCEWRDFPNAEHPEKAPEYLQRGIPAPDPFGTTFSLKKPPPDLVIVLLQGQTLGQIQTGESELLKAGIPVLFASQTHSGWQLGPTAVPGLPGFWEAFAQRYASILKGASIARLTHLRTLPWQVSDGHLNHLFAEVNAILHSNGTPNTLGRICLFDWVTGGRSILELNVSGVSQSAVKTLQLSPLAQTCLKRFHSSLNARAGISFSSPQAPRVHPSVAIVGGGTAGYLTALAFQRMHPQTKLTLIESPNVPVIGVGEATTPLMLQFLHVDLGIDIQDFFQKVRPTFKLGIHFDWGRSTQESFPYPFGPMHLFSPETKTGHFWSISSQSLLMELGNLPIFQGDCEAVKARWDRNIAYHLDNRLFVAYLQDLAAARGVRIKKAHIAKVVTSDDGATVRELQTDQGESLRFQWFIDCTGFRALLLEGALGSGFKSYHKTLFTDRALIAKVLDPEATPPFTRATTMNAGWCWNTPQRTEHHCGYVFSSQFLSTDQAEEEMRNFLPTMTEPALIKFRSGRHDHFIKGNVAAMGNAYGFVEPLESTALHMLIRQIGMLLQAWPEISTNGERQARLNRRLGDFWDYLCWFLGLHFRFNQRLHSPFWKACRNSVCLDRHADLLVQFREHGPLSLNPQMWTQLGIPDPLWGPEGIDLLLLAQGVGQTNRDVQEADESTYHNWLASTLERLKPTFPQAEALSHLDRNPHLLQKLAETFRQGGPAFQ